MRRYTVTLLVLAALAGCSKVKAPDPDPDPDAAAKDSWAQFVSRAKGNIGKAISDSNGELFNAVEIKWISDDIEKSASLKHPYEGTVRVKSVLLLGNRFDHTMRFGYEDGRWVFLGGQEVNSSRSFELTSLRFDYLKTMFEQ